MTFQPSPYAAIYFLAGIVSLVVAFLSWRRRAIPCGASLALLMFAIAEWSLAGAVEMAAVGIPAKIFWSVVAYLGTTTSPIAFLIFALEYTHQSKWLTRLKLIAYLFVPLVIIVLAATNDWHHLIWTSFTPSFGNILIYGHGIGFWALVAYSYTAIVIGFVLLVRALFRLRAPYRRQAAILVIGALIPIGADILYVFEQSPIPGLDLTPMAFALMGLVLVFGIFRFQLLDLAPVAREALLEEIADGVIVLDMQNRIVDSNPAAAELLGVAAPMIGQPIARVCPPLTPIEPSSEIIIGENSPRTLDVKISRLRDRRANVTGRLLIVRDITESKRAQAALRELNINLERAVAERTEELQITVAKLQTEIAERERVEASLRQMEESLAQRVAEQSRQLTALYEVILVAEQSDSINEMQKQALATIMSAMNCQAGCIHQRDEKSGVLHLIAQHDLNVAQQAQIEILPSDWLSNDNIPHVVIDLATDARVPHAIRLPGLASYLGVPTHSHGKPTGALGIFWRDPRALGVEDIALFSAMADQLDLIVENARLREKSQVAAVQQERRRLARDLHDSVTQSLHSLVLSADTTRALAQRHQLELLEPTVAQLAESARQALKEMRLMLFELRLATLDQMNLVEQLETRLDLVERRAGVDAQFDVDESLSLPPEWTRELYPIAMEALNNALRYAQATQVWVTLRGNPDSFRFEIADNGKGFDTQHPRAGMGLQSMRERAERVGGTFAIESAPAQGTRVRVRITQRNSGELKGTHRNS